MGKIYRVLRLSGNVFEQKDFSKRALSENAQRTSLKKIYYRLRDLGLSKDQISEQSLKELNKSLHQIDGYIVRPESFLNQKFKNTVNSVTNFKLNILPILLERRMFVLESIDELVSRSKISNLRRLVKRISDISVKSSIEKILDELQIRNSILKKEYQKLEKLRLNIYSEQQKFTSLFKELTERKDKTSKYFQSRESMTTLMMGILLILITFVISFKIRSGLRFFNIFFTWIYSENFSKGWK